MTHTPKPWFVGGPYPGVSVCYVTELGEWVPIAELWKWQDGEVPQEVKDNANLMAASPKILNALVDMLALIDEHGSPILKAHATRIMSAHSAVHQASAGEDERYALRRDIRDFTLRLMMGAEVRQDE